MKNILFRTDRSGAWASGLEERCINAEKDVELLSLITTAVMQSLEPEQVLYTILTALTSKEGFGFNRAVYFEADTGLNILKGKMGLGPLTGEEANEIWNFIDTEKLTLQNLIDRYERFKQAPATGLNRMVSEISIPLREDGCLLSLSVLEGMPFEVTTENSRKKLTPELREKMDLGAFVTVPLMTRNRTHGTLLVDKRFSCEPITRNCLKILTIFAGHAALAIENSSLYDRTVHLSRTDWLTGLWNARYFDTVFREKTRVAASGEGKLSLLLIDIDRFKQYNDSLGHYEGDRAIRKVSEILRESSRKCDTVSRYGGEEFCVIMNDIDKQEAFAIAERIREKIAGAFGSGPLASDLKLTVSQGLSHLPTDGCDTTTLFKKADKALYKAKSAGKNTTRVYQPDMAVS